MTAALPFLSRAKSVHSFEVDAATGKSGALAELREYLALRGIERRRARRRSRPRSRLGEALALAVQAQRCELLVLGGYGHSRIREFVLGGVTRHILRHGCAIRRLDDALVFEVDQRFSHSSDLVELDTLPRRMTWKQRSTLPSLFRRAGTSFGEHLGDLQRQMDRLFDDFAGRWPVETSGNGNGKYWPALDMTETNDAVDVTAELPGIDPKDVDIVGCRRHVDDQGRKEDRERNEGQELLLHRTQLWRVHAQP